METFKLNILGCLDVRLSQANRKWIETQHLRSHPSGKALFSNQNGSIGGIGVLLDGVWGQRCSGTYNDPSGLGLVYEVQLQTMEGMLRVLFVYWPVVRSVVGSASLHSKLEEWLLAAGWECTPEEYLKRIISSRVKKPSWRTIVGGDLNATPGSERVRWLKSLLPHRAHAALPAFATHYAGDKEGRQIDHILSSGPVASAGMSNDKCLSVFSDHTPIWCHIEAESGPTILTPPTPPRDGRRPINFNSAEAVEEMHRKVRAALPTANLHQLAAAITEASTRPRQKDKVVAWTPIQGGRLLCLSYLHRIRKAPHKLEALMDTLRNRVLEIGKDGAAVWVQLEPVVRQVCCSTTTQRRDKVTEVLTQVREEYQKERREEARRTLQECKNRREDPARLFKELRPPKLQLNLSRLDHHGRTITDPVEIHEVMTQSFELKFGPHLYAEAAMTENYPALLREIPLVLNNPAIPDQIHQAFVRAFSSTAATRQGVEDQLSPLAQGPTLALFKHELKLSSSKSAAGRSGLSYQMLKHQEEDVIERLHELLLQQWRRGDLDAWLNDKLLIVIPKKDGSTTMANMRPIVLVEVLRKVWTGTFTRAMREAFEANHVLQPQQHGFRARRGTSACLLQMLNLWDSAEALHHPLLFSSWDVKDAFPSVPRYVAFAAMRRLGVPHPIASFLATIDNHETILVDSPHSRGNKRARTFRTHRGLGQGDKGSPCIWLCVMDILLTLVNQVPSDVHFSTRDGAMAAGRDTAYADDFVTYASSLETLQLKADLFSAGTALLGLEIATAKLRSGTVNVAQPGTLTVHNARWEPTEVNFSAPGDFIKYLGAKRDLDGSSRSEFRNLTDITAVQLQNLRSKLGSARAKKVYLKGSTIAKLSYPASFSVGPLKAYRAQDTEIGKFLKETNRLPMNWPGPLLYCPERWGGIGMPRFSDCAQIAKLRILFAGLRGDTDTRAATSGLLERIATRETKHTWLLSLLSYLQENKCELRRGGIRYASDHPDDTMLHPGQFWAIGGRVWQIGGWSENSITGWIWDTCQPASGRQGRKQRYHKGALASIAWDNLTGEEELLQTVWKSNYLEITNRVTQAPCRYTYACSSVNWPEGTLTQVPSRICTDGSWSTAGAFWDASPLVGAGIAVLYPNMQHPPLLLTLQGTYFHCTQRNYTQELVGLLIGAALKRDTNSEGPIHTDCESALKALGGERARKDLNCSQLLHMVRQITHGNQLHFVKAHTSAAPTPSDSDIYGNFLADLAADRSSHQATILPRDILLDIADSTGLWYVADNQELAPAALPVEEGYYLEAHQYFSLRRDRHHMFSSPTMAQVQLAMASHGKQTEAQRGALLKLLLNRFDDDRLLEEGKLLIRCACDNLSHLTAWTSSCVCSEIKTVRDQCIADLKTLLYSRTAVRDLIIGKLMRAKTGYDIWRGRWCTKDLRDFERCVRTMAPDLMRPNQRGAERLLHKIIKTITTSALNLHSTGRRLRTQTQGHTPGSQDYTRERRGALRLPCPTGQPRITQFFRPLPGTGTNHNSPTVAAPPPQIGLSTGAGSRASPSDLPPTQWEIRTPRRGLDIRPVPQDNTESHSRIARTSGQAVPSPTSGITSPAQAEENQVFDAVVNIGR
jgi:hypothetical protein